MPTSKYIIIHLSHGVNNVCLKQPHSSLSDAEANLNGELTHLSLKLHEIE